MRAPVAKAGIVSAVTTLVQAGVAQGLSLAQSEAPTARQLQVSASSLYLNYLMAGTAQADQLLIMDWAIVESLRDSIPLVVGGASQAANQLILSRLNYTSAQTWDARFYHYTNNHNGQTGTAEVYVLPTGRVNGAMRVATSAFTPSWGDGPNGWVPGMTEANINYATSGSPYSTLWSTGARNASVEIETDVAGRSIASVAQAMQDPSLNSSPTAAGINTSTLVGNMPAGAKAWYVKWKARYGDFYSESSRITNTTTLNGMVAGFPTPTSPTPANTVSFGGTTATGICANNICPGLNLRASFEASANRVDYYRCDSDSSFTTISNCVASGSGAYSIGTSNDGVTPLMRLTNSPSTLMGGLVERNGQVYVISKSSGTGFAAGKAVRLNRAAYNALATALGIDTAPTLTARSPYLGMWRASYTGTDSGGCAWMLVDALGNLSSTCASASSGAFPLVGTVSDLGSFSTAGTGSLFGGVFLATSASGTWTQPSSGGNGSWTATKR